MVGFILVCMCLVEVSFEHGNGISGSIDGRKFLDYLSDYRLLKKGAPSMDLANYLTSLTSSSLTFIRIRPCDMFQFRITSEFMNQFDIW
jgi:hypothetical protein